MLADTAVRMPVPTLKRLFRCDHHYSHALEIRSMLSSDYLFQRAHHEAYPKGLLRKIWTKPGNMEDCLSSYKTE